MPSTNDNTHTHNSASMYTHSHPTPTPARIDRAPTLIIISLRLLPSHRRGWVFSKLLHLLCDLWGVGV